MIAWLLPLAIGSFGLVTFAMRGPRPKRPKLNRLGLPNDRLWRL